MPAAKAKGLPLVLSCPPLHPMEAEETEPAAKPAPDPLDPADPFYRVKPETVGDMGFHSLIFWP